MKYNKDKRVYNYYNHLQMEKEFLERIYKVDVDILDCVRYHHNKEGI